MNDLGLDLLYKGAAELLPARTPSMTLERALRLVEAQAFDEVGRSLMRKTAESFLVRRDPKLLQAPEDLRASTIEMLFFAAFRGLASAGWQRKQIQHVIPRCFLKLFHDEHKWTGPNRPRHVIPKLELSRRGVVESFASGKSFTHKKRGVHPESVEHMLSLIECRFADKMNREPDSILMLENVLAFASMLTARVATWERPDLSTVAGLTARAVELVESVELNHVRLLTHRARAFSPLHPVRQVSVDRQLVTVVPLGAQRTLMLSANGEYEANKVLALQTRGQLKRGLGSKAPVAFYGSSLLDMVRSL